MERRGFIKTSLLSGLGICIIPISGIALSNGSSVFSKTNILSEGHVRHGLFNPNVGEIHQFSSWFSNFKKDVFHKNGFGASNDDLINLSFELNHNKIAIHKLDNTVLTITEKVNHRINLTTSNRITIFDSPEFSCELYKFSDAISLKKTKDQYIYPISEAIGIGNRIIDENEIVNITEEADMKALDIHPVESTATIIIISKK